MSTSQFVARNPTPRWLSVETSKSTFFALKMARCRPLLRGPQGPPAADHGAAAEARSTEGGRPGLQAADGRGLGASGAEMELEAG